MLVTHGHAHLMHATKADCGVFDNSCIVKQHYTYADVHSASETCVYSSVCHVLTRKRVKPCCTNAAVHACTITSKCRAEPACVANAFHNVCVKNCWHGFCHVKLY